MSCVICLAAITASRTGAQRARLPAADTARVAMPGYRARILGVYDDDSGEPIEGVHVIDVLSGTWSQTTATGTVALAFLPEGGSLLRLQKIGYATQTVPAAISPADTLPITLTMKRLTHLPTMVTTDAQPHYISPLLRGFEARMAIGDGYYIGEAELRKNDGRPLANVLQTKPGVMLFHGRSFGATYLLRSPRCAAGGPPQVYLDGVALTPPPPQINQAPTKGTTAFGANGAGAAAQDDMARLPFDLSQFDVTELAGVEWYPDSDMLPIEFAHSGKRCGALLLWTRER